MNEFNTVKVYKINIKNQPYFYVLAMNTWTPKFNSTISSFIITQKIHTSKTCTLKNIKF